MTTLSPLLEGLADVPDPRRAPGMLCQRPYLLAFSILALGTGCNAHRSIALDGKTPRGGFDKFRDRAAAQVLSASATDTAFVLAHFDIAEKSDEIPAAQKHLAELGIASGAIVTLAAMPCQNNTLSSPHRQMLA